MKYEIRTADNGWIVSWVDEGEDGYFIEYHRGFTYSQELDRTDREELMEELRVFAEMCRFLAEKEELYDTRNDTHRLMLKVITQSQWDSIMDMLHPVEVA